MAISTFPPSRDLSLGSALKSFVFPLHPLRSEAMQREVTRVSAIVPTHAPTDITLRLIKDLLRWNPYMQVYVVDDDSLRGDLVCARLFAEMARLSPRAIVLRTPTNKLKAGALNHALARIWQSEDKPDVILTLDDDVVVERETVKHLVAELLAYEHLGAVCSACKVFNKNKNFLTRLQSLEYVGFNAIRLADEGFMRGPLVMHGMLTAFRAEALREAGGFSEGHLIEDYEVTTRLKEHGWHVRSVLSAPAWTVVPETLSRLWRQRTRWSYGGITVVSRARVPAVFQDILGHAVFISMLTMVFALFFSGGNGLVPPVVAELIIALSLLQLGITYTFQVWLLGQYEEGDRWDWLIRLLLFPEFAYSYLMTVALLGSYVFHFFVTLKTKLPSLPLGRVSRAFRTLGYAENHWGIKRRV